MRCNLSLSIKLKNIGKLFWELEEFLDSYEYRFVSIVETIFNRSKRRTETYKSKKRVHNQPYIFKKLPQSNTIYFKQDLRKIHFY